MHKSKNMAQESWCKGDNSFFFSYSLFLEFGHLDEGVV
jgi:hypothetical protein